MNLKLFSTKNKDAIKHLTT